MQQQTEEEILKNLEGLREVLAKNQLFPVKFEPINSARFICTHSNNVIDEFSVKRIEKLPIHTKRRKTQVANFFGIKLKNPQLACVGNLVVVYHSPIAPSILGEVHDAFQEGVRLDLSVKYLDPTATVISLREYKNCAIKSFELSPPDYSHGNKVEEIKVTYSCKSMDFIY